MLQKRVCRKCKKEKELSFFGRDSSVLSGYKVTCRKCISEYNCNSNKSLKADYSNKYYHANKERLNALAKARRKGEDPTPYLKTTVKVLQDRDSKYLERSLYKRNKEKQWIKQGIKNFTYSNYETMLNFQKGVCYLCSNPPIKGKSLCVDHNHITGKVRKLLCFDCNTSIGKLGDSIQGLTRALNYLNDHE